MTTSTPRFARIKHLTPLGEWIESQLKEQGVSKPQLAAELGCETTTLYRWMQKEEDAALRPRVSAALKRITERAAAPPPERVTDPYDRLLKGVLEEFTVALSDPSGMIPVEKAARWVFTLQKVYELVRERETLLKNIEQNVYDVIWTTDLSLAFKYHSPSVQDLRGLTPLEANRLSIEETLTEESAGIVHDLYAELSARLERYRRNPKLAPIRTLFPPNWHEDLKLETYHKNGEPVAVEVRISLLRNENGEPDGVMGVSRSVEGRSVQDRKDYEKKLNQLLFDVDTPIAFVDKDGEYIEVNEAFTSLLKYKTEDLLGMTFLDITDAKDKDESQKRFEDLINGNSEDYRFEKTYISQDNRRVRARVSVIRIPLASRGALPPVVCVMVPLTKEP